MKTNIRTGYVQLRKGDWFAGVDSGSDQAGIIVARSLAALAKKADWLREIGYEIDKTAWLQIGSGSDAYTKPHHNAI